MALPFRRHVALDGHILPRPPVEAQRSHVRIADRRHARRRLQPLPQPPAELVLALDRVTRIGEREVRYQNVVRVETGMERARGVKTLYEQPGADQRHGRQRDFTDHQQAPQPVRPRAGLLAAPALLQRFVQIRPQRNQQGGHAGYQGAHHAYPHRPRQHPAVQLKAAIQPHGGVHRREQPGERPRYPRHEEDSQESARGRGHEGLGEQLTRQPPAPRAQREPDGEFFLARRGAGEQQVGDISARDEQHHRAYGHEDVQGPPQYRLRAAHMRFGNRQDGDAGLRIRGGIGKRQVAGPCRGFRARLLQAYARLQPRKKVQVPGAPVRQHRRSSSTGAVQLVDQRERRPQVLR